MAAPRLKDNNGDLIAEYQYDPFGRRVSKTVYDPPDQNPETTWYVYSDQGLMAELDETGLETEFYLFPPDGLWSTDPILRKAGSSYFYYQTDHLGTPQQLVDGSGAVVHSREIRAFGEVAASGVEDRWRFPGQLVSQEMGLYYNYHRDYDPATGRYVRSDPMGHKAGVNFYIYAQAHPVSEIDPLGLFSMNNECPECGSDKEEEIEKAIQNECNKARNRITPKSLNACIGRRCDEAKVDIFCCSDRTDGLRGGYNCGDIGIMMTEFLMVSPTVIPGPMRGCGAIRSRQTIHRMMLGLDVITRCNNDS